jgi:hypothetical protein
MTYEEAIAQFPTLGSLSEGELRVRLSALTNMSEPEWHDFFSLPPEAKAVAVLNYAGASWVQGGDVLTEVLAVLAVLGAIAGAVSGVAGAASAVAALRAL